MDLLIVAILVASAILVYVLMRGRDRYPLGKIKGLSRMPPVAKSAHSGWPSSGTDQDSTVRFSDSQSRRNYRLLNDSEQILYFRLCEAIPNMLVFAQVGVAQLAQLRGHKEARRLSTMLGRGVDFVICDSDFAIVAAIDLAWPADDGSENSPEEEKRRALQSLGIPLIVYRPNDLPDVDRLSREITNAAVHRKRLEVERRSTR